MEVLGKDKACIAGHEMRVESLQDERVKEQLWELVVRETCTLTKLADEDLAIPS